MEQAYFHQTVYHHGESRLIDGGAEPGFWPYATSIGPRPELLRWHERVRPWLLTSEHGAPAPSLFYGVFDGEAVLMRRTQQPNAAKATAHLLIGPAKQLPPRIALELRDWTWAPGVVPVPVVPLISGRELNPHRSPLADEARAPDLAGRLMRLLSWVFAGPSPVVSPVGPRDAALLWGVCDILSALGAGLPQDAQWPIGFETFDDRPEPRDLGGLFLRFSDGAPALPQRDDTFETARKLVQVYRAGGVVGLRAYLDQGRVLSHPSMAARIAQAAGNGRPPTAGAQPGPQAGPQAAPGQGARSAPAPKGDRLTCPICLGDLTWGGLELYSYDLNLDQYVPLVIPAQASEKQRARLMRTASVKCPNQAGITSVHYLPAAYGEFGRPSIFGLVGGSASGKTHLLAAMIGAIEQGDLSAYGLTAQPIDLDRHREYVRNRATPLLADGKWLPATAEGVIQFVDGFIISSGSEQRPMALYDVAGGDLLDIEDAKHFLEIADGLIFVIDPERLSKPGGLGDPTFGTVLELLRSSRQLANVSAAIVLSKADLLRFDDPIAYWLRHDDNVLDSAQALEESADVYAYLHQRGAKAWARPYQECSRATLHVASATGTSAVERGVRPMRVLKPLVSLMAMTGMIHTSDAETMGI
jgi:hypothetical protein